MPDLASPSRGRLTALLVRLHTRIEELSAENARLGAALEAKRGGGKPSEAGKASA
ncbi:MAG TPA: hypothetical protein PLD23_08415 [Armatimonadota bacterium]|nr:hypothetical protein [Armatimonadota bacterium]